MKKITCSATHILKKPYARILIPTEDGTYSAELLEFPGCYTQGDTPQEAMDNLDDAAEAWIDAAIEQGQDIPEPFATHGYSGKVSLRLPRSIHKKAASFAQKDGVSLNNFFTSAIAARVGAEDFCEQLINRIEERLHQRPSLSGIFICCQSSQSISLNDIHSLGREFGEYLFPATSDKSLPSTALTRMIT